jgi:flagellum-specific peptidoglycan hydrolase FlgJ
MDANEYERILEVRTKGNEFSKERFRAKLNELNVRFADVAVAQAILETNTFRSSIFMENNNLFGMKEAKTRINLARGSQYGHAYYDSWEDSVLDYAMWCATYAKHCRTNEQFLSLLNGYYAEDPNYIAKLRRIMSRQ